MKRKRFRISLGDTGHGPLGCEAVVWADNESEAIERLKDFIGYGENLLVDEEHEYIAVYFNPDKINLDTDVAEESAVDTDDEDSDD